MAEQDPEIEKLQIDNGSKLLLHELRFLNKSLYGHGGEKGDIPTIKEHLEKVNGNIKNNSDRSLSNETRLDSQGLQLQATQDTAVEADGRSKTNEGQIKILCLVGAPVIVAILSLLGMILAST